MVIENFKCFKNKTEFNFNKTDYKLLKRNVYDNILKGALFVGDNASGKTTAIQPIRLLLDLLLKDMDVRLPMYKCLFSDRKVTKLEYEFEIDNQNIKYFFSFERKKFLEEKLWVEDEIILEREENYAKLHLEDDVEFYDIDDTLLFAKRVYFNTKFAENKTVAKWFDYLKKSVYLNALTRKTRSYNNESLAPRKYIEEQGTNRFNKFFKDYNFKYTLQCIERLQEDDIQYTTKEDDENIFFKREGIDVIIPAYLESMGNLTLISILPAMFHVVDNGGMLIIDEFSSGFHNKLEELIVRYIMQNGETTQLFFVSHSTNLLSNSILRPDQIYAVEMQGKEGSKLFRFSDEQPRAAQNMEKMYLSGVFGGIPEYGTDEE